MDWFCLGVEGGRVRGIRRKVGCLLASLFVKVVAVAGSTKTSAIVESSCEERIGWGWEDA